MGFGEISKKKRAFAQGEEKANIRKVVQNKGKKKTAYVV